MGKLRPGEDTPSLESWERCVLTFPSAHAPPASQLLLSYFVPAPSPDLEPGTRWWLLGEFNWIQEAQTDCR